VVASIFSYRHAESVADRFVGPLPHEVGRFRAAPIPFRRAPVSERWSWAIAYGDRNHDGFEVYVSFRGHVVGTNPLDVKERLDMLRGATGRESRPTP
jgi:hypothetical protein